MKIYATYNIKGGVGKTSAAVNLAHLAARSGYNALLWDLDPQGAATYMFRVRPKVKGGSRALVEGTRSLTMRSGPPISTGSTCCQRISAIAIWICSWTT